MKKNLVCLVCLLFVLGIFRVYAGDNTLQGQNSEHENDMSFRYSTMEYGATDTITNEDSPLIANIRFPHYDYLFDKSIEYWAHMTYEMARAEVYELFQTDSSVTGEINIYFDSFVYDDIYVGFLFRGYFIHSLMERPMTIVHTVNMDLSRNVFLDNAEIINPELHAGVLSLLRTAILAEHPEKVEFLSDIDDSLLNLLTISSDGIIVTIDGSLFSPDRSELFYVTLPFDMLGLALTLGAELPAIESETSEEPLAFELIPLRIPLHIDPSRPMVALTFDDGPSTYTSYILDILEKHNVRATFFTIGNRLEPNMDIALRAVSLGNEIIGHSWDHSDMTRLTDAQIKQQILNTNFAVEAITGVETRIFRPPFGAVNDRVQRVSRELGFAIINWSIDPMDWRNRNADIVYEAIMNNARNNAIILSHDLYDTTVEAMERVIPALIAQGYQLVTVSELLAFSYDVLEAGVVYRHGNL